MGNKAAVMKKKKVQEIVSEDSPLRHNPFDRLKTLKKQSTALLPGPKPPQKKIEAQPSEEQIFSEAMEGIRPLAQDRFVCGSPVRLSFREGTAYKLENDELSRLAKLIDRGEGFVVSDTPEYMEGTGYHVNREFARRLHEGDFALAAHLDLHGMNVETAGKAFESFMKASYLSGKRAVLVIHGRGLSSPGEAILKNKVRQWLGLSYWRKRVLAYASAQSHDGGAGATYVLFRERPVSKKSA